jgi:polar amino acid transport system substrate-binding protein
MKRRLLSIASTVFALALAGCSSASASASVSSADSSAAVYRTVDEIKSSGKITIGVFTDKAPFGYIDENGDNQGYDVYYAKRIAKDLGVDAEFVSEDPANRAEFVNTGKVDITLANFTVTDEREEQVDFANPYMKVSLGVVSPDSAVITDVKDLKELIVAKGTTAETYFEENYPDVKLIKYDAYQDAYNALMDGRGPAFATDNTEVLAWANQNKGYTVGITELGDYQPIAAAVASENTTLKDWLNNELVTLGEEKFFHADYEATLKSVYGDDADPDSMVVEGGKM